MMMLTSTSAFPSDSELGNPDLVLLLLERILRESLVSARRGPIPGLERGTLLLVEEVGEAVMEAVGATRKTLLPQDRRGHRDAMIRELEQVGAMTLRLLIELEEERCSD